MSYPVTAAFVNIYNIKYRDLAIKAKFAQNAALKNDLSFKLGLLFFQWDFSFSQTDVQKNLVSQYESAVAQLKTLEGGGMAAHSKVLQAQARLESAKVELSACENHSDSMRIELVNFIQGADTTVVPEPYAFHADNSGPLSVDTISLNTGRPGTYGNGHDHFAIINTQRHPSGAKIPEPGLRPSGTGMGNRA